MVLFPEGLKAVTQGAQESGVDLRGAYLNLDGGFDSAHHRTCIFNAGLLPHSKEHPRNRKAPKRGRKRLGNSASTHDACASSGRLRGKTSSSACCSALNGSSNGTTA
jgi:hypothetical protein